MCIGPASIVSWWIFGYFWDWVKTMQYGLSLCVIVPFLGSFLCYLVEQEQSRAVPAGTESALAGDSQYLSLVQIRAETCYASGIDIGIFCLPNVWEKTNHHDCQYLTVLVGNVKLPILVDIASYLGSYHHSSHRSGPGVHRPNHKAVRSPRKVALVLCGTALAKSNMRGKQICDGKKIELCREGRECCFYSSLLTDIRGARTARLDSVASSKGISNLVRGGADVYWISLFRGNWIKDAAIAIPDFDQRREWDEIGNLNTNNISYVRHLCDLPQ